MTTTTMAAAAVQLQYDDEANQTATTNTTMPTTQHDSRRLASQRTADKDWRSAMTAEDPQNPYQQPRQYLTDPTRTPVNGHCGTQSGTTALIAIYK